MPIVRANGTTLHYHMKGKGTPLIFIHPPLMTCINFAYPLQLLSDRYRVVVFDIRGHGHSAPSEVPLTYPLIVEDIKQMMDELGLDKAYLCGYSTGGTLVLEALLTYPERFFGGINVSGMPEVGDVWLKAKVALAVAMTGMKAKRPLLFSVSLGNADQAATFWNLYRDAKAGHIRNWREYYRCSLQTSVTSRLGSIRHPVLSIYGEKDRKFHRYMRMLDNGLPRHEARIIPKAKHQIPTKAAEPMCRIIDEWIKSLSFL